LKLLVGRGDLVDWVDLKYGWTPLSWAAVEGHEALVKMLLERGAAVDSIDTETGRPPLSILYPPFLMFSVLMI